MRRLLSTLREHGVAAWAVLGLTVLSFTLEGAAVLLIAAFLATVLAPVWAVLPLAAYLLLTARGIDPRGRQ